MRGRHAAGSAQLEPARFEQVIENQGEDVIRRYERSVAVEDSEAVGVAVGRESGERLLLAHGLFERGQILFRWVGPCAVEQHVALGANSRGSAIPFSLRMRSSQPAPHPCSASHTNLPLALRSTSKRIIRWSCSKYAPRGSTLSKSSSSILCRGFVFQAAAARFSMSLVTSGSAGPPSGPENFNPLYCRRIVAGRDVHPAVELSVDDGVRDGGSRRGLAAQKHAAAVGSQHRGRAPRKFLGEEIVCRSPRAAPDSCFATLRDRRWPPTRVVRLRT